MSFFYTVYLHNFVFFLKNNLTVFLIRYEHVKKSAIEQKIRDFFVKEKRDKDTKPVWYLKETKEESLVDKLEDKKKEFINTEMKETGLTENEESMLMAE